MENAVEILEAEVVGSSMVPVEPVAVAMPSVNGVRAYKTKKGVRYMALVRLYGCPPASKSFRTEREARAWKRDQESELSKLGSSAAISVPKIKLGDVNGKPGLFSQYVGYRIKNGTSSYDIERMYDRLKEHVLLKHVNVGDVDAKLARQYCESRRDGTHSAPVEPASISPEFARVALAIREMARIEGWRAIDPWNSAVRTDMAESGLIEDSEERDRRPSASEMDAQMAVFKQFLEDGTSDVPMADISGVAVSNAFRRTEITHLRWSDLNVAHSAIYCWDRKDSSRKARRRSKVSGVIEKKSSRTLVPLLPAALEIILRQPRAAHIKLGEPTPGVIPGSVEDLIFPYASDTVGGMWEKARDLNAKTLPGIADLRFHDLRHEAITRFAAVLSTSDAMKISGHKTERSFRRYINHTIEDARRIADLTASLRVMGTSNVVPLKKAA